MDLSKLGDTMTYCVSPKKDELCTSCKRNIQLQDVECGTYLSVYRIVKNLKTGISKCEGYLCEK